MAILTKEQRNQLSKVVLAARAATEPAARKALHSLGVDEADAPSYLSAEQRALRRALRAQARQLGDKEDPRKKGSYDLYHLREKIAYDQWHRMLFARFLAENELLISPAHGVAVSLAECRELAPEIGLKDEWDVAVRFAAKSLPQSFRPDDPTGKIDLAPEDRALLRDLVVGLPRDTFIADDSLGWVYQFWQAKRKDEVNQSEKKIGADEIAPVTQLFTEHYMVEFLLHNTLGAWWLKKRKAEGKDPSLNGIEFTYLRLKDDGTPAAGTFSGWPKQAKELRVLDPCMGSGHFLVTELPILVSMRMEEEGLSKPEACDAVLRENLFGLEIDARCTQIAAFNLACSGLGINARKEEWLKLANGEDRLRRGMEQLYDLFQQAPVLGSLINPKGVGGDLLVAHFHELQPLLEKALARETAKNDENLAEMGVTARGLAHAAEILASQFNLVATNVPYLGRVGQCDLLKEFCDSYYDDAKWDLATVFVTRCGTFCVSSGVLSVITPQQWCYGDKYKEFRKGLLQEREWKLFARLGTNAFRSISGEVVNVALLVAAKRRPSDDHRVLAVDATEAQTPDGKAEKLASELLVSFLQIRQLRNPDSRITLSDPSDLYPLSKVAKSTEGLSAGDGERFILKFWEKPNMDRRWEFLQSAPETTEFFQGLTDIILWDEGHGELSKSPAARIRGHTAWGKPGIVVAKMNTVRSAVYLGGLFAKNCVVLSSTKSSLCPAIFEFVNSPEFDTELERLDANLNTATSVFEKVAFNVDQWTGAAAAKYPDGLPSPYSNNTTQWLFHGHPKGSDQPLHVAVARLLGYWWPRQTGSSFPDCPALGLDGLEQFADADGIACINPIKGEHPAAERLRALLALSFGAEWTPGKQNELLEQTGFGGKALEDWLRNGFFERHCELFHQRPFIWHIWDGRRDGFSALVNYHKLNRSTLEKLTYTFLGDWIARQKAANDAGEEGSDARLQAAQELKSKLEKIIEGEAPYDTFVRWKPLEKQPMGWEPDLNDGVRLNIRPFVEAGVLRKNPKINWKKDRGKDVASAPWYKVFKGDRINDHHLSLAEKRKARGKQ